MPPLLLVTGSRSLAILPGAEAWARGEVARALDELGPGAAVLHGGATGPDVWCGEVARERGHRVVTYLPNGWRLDTHRLTRRWAEGDPGPLPRNRAMVAAAVRVRDGGDPVLVLGLVDPGSRTQGARYTLRLAREAGLDRWEREWPGAENGCDGEK